MKISPDAAEHTKERKDMSKANFPDTSQFLSINDMVDECCTYFVVSPDRINRKYAQTMLRKRINEIKEDYEKSQTSIDWLHGSYEVRKDFFNGALLEDPTVMKYFVKRSDIPDANSVPRLKTEMLSEVKAYTNDPPTFDNTPYANSVYQQLPDRTLLELISEKVDSLSKIQSSLNEVLRFVQLLSSELLGFDLTQYDKDKQKIEELSNYMYDINFYNTADYAGYSTEENAISTHDLLLYTQLISLDKKVQSMHSYTRSKHVKK